MVNYSAQIVVTITYNAVTCTIGQQYTFNGTIPLTNIGDTGAYAHDDRSQCGLPIGAIQMITAKIIDEEFIQITGAMQGDWGHALYFQGQLVCQAPGGGIGSGGGYGNGTIQYEYAVPLGWKKKRRGTR